MLTDRHKFGKIEKTLQSMGMTGVNKIQYQMIPKLISFVIPCYRSENTIEKVYDEIIETVSQRPEYDYEIITVNDCSPDDVLSVLKSIAAKDSKFKVIDLAKNFGKHSAMMAGFSYVQGELVVNLDDDYQCPVSELWKLVDAIVDEDYDCATAVYARKKEAAWKLLGSKINAHMVNMLIEPPKGISVENFFVIKRYVCDEILNYQNPYPYVNGLLMKATHRIKMIPMYQRERGDDKNTGFTLKKSMELFANGLTAFSIKPLRIASIIGMLFAMLGFIYGIYIVGRKLVYPDVPLGYSSMMAVQLFSSGIIMLILGLIGEYLGRIYISINNSPQYVIRETFNINTEISR